ncbi:MULTISPECIES: phage major tropism determinant [unclassified Methylococcus]|uniref:phage major tropism determinant n=1 Tax=unclassified Methylococcus TaxID=2618889 RepID=UPI003D7F0D90
MSGWESERIARRWFAKSNSLAPVWIAPGGWALAVGQEFYAEVGGRNLIIPANRDIILPESPAPGTDYAIWLSPNGVVQASSNFVTPPNTPVDRKIGGFHYAPGGNAPARAGGDTTPKINPYSMWDLNFRPACPDPRGMTLVADSFWMDIYLLGVDYLVNGTSKYNVTIADGGSPPKISTKFGGNGTSVYADGSWHNLGEALRHYGKRHPTPAEAEAAFFGTTEASSLGSDPVSTVLNAAYTSKWGVIQSTGVMHIWGSAFGGGAAGASWVANTGGRGSTYQAENAVLLAGGWSNGGNAGSGCAYWSNSPAYSLNNIGARGVCDHMRRD